jgi:hypothetical protein
MTTTTHPHAATRTDPAERRLRTVLGLNATSSLIGGLVALLAAGWTADTLGVDTTGWVRLIGAGLVVFALDVGLLARTSTATLRRWTPAVSAGDAAWVVATVVLLALGAFSGAGVVIAVALGLAVADFGLLQMRFRNAL